MAHTCNCGDRSGCSASAITPDRTVGEISHDVPGALEVLQAKGINHCCGAQLTLREAAALASMPLDELLDALRVLERVSA